MNVFKIAATNKKHPKHTHHWILADSIDDALRIAIKFKIGNPMFKAIDHRPIDARFNVYKRYGNEKGSRVWFESDGELHYHKTPLAAHVPESLLEEMGVYAFKR